MKSLFALAVLCLSVSAFSADLTCTGLADGHEDLTVKKDSVVVLDEMQEIELKISSRHKTSEGELLIINKGLIVHVDNNQQNAIVFTGDLKTYLASDCETSKNSFTCRGKQDFVSVDSKKKRDRVSGEMIEAGTVSFKKGKKAAVKMPIMSTTGNMITGQNLKTASHYSVDAILVYKPADGGAISMNGRLYSYDCK